MQTYTPHSHFHQGPKPHPSLKAQLCCDREKMSALKRYVIVRDIPGIHEKDVAELGSISAASCSALGKAGHGRVQWAHSYVAGDKTFCIYLAESEEAIREHAKHGSFPISSIHEVTTIIDPTTAGSAQ